MKMDGIYGILVIVCSLAAVAQGRELCTISEDSDPYTYGIDNLSFKWCRYGCCGDWPDQQCCPVKTWIIVVSVIGSIIFVSVVITCICCICKKGTGQRGQVIPPGQQQPGGRAVVYTTTSGAQPYNRGYQPEPTTYWNQPPAPAPTNTGASQPGQNPVVPSQDSAYPSRIESTTTKTS